MRTIPALAIIVVTLAGCHSAGGLRKSLEGGWVCGPYSMSGPSFKMTVTSNVTYGSDGSYEAESEYVVDIGSAVPITTRNRAIGSWEVDGDVITTRIAKVRFLESSDPSYTIQDGQSDLESQLELKNWSRSRVTSSSRRMLSTVPVNPMYTGANVEVSCKKN